MSRVVKNVDPLLGKTYNSSRLSSSQDDFRVLQQKDGNHRGMIKIFSSFLCMYL